MEDREKIRRNNKRKRNDKRLIKEIVGEGTPWARLIYVDSDSYERRHRR